MSVVAILSLSGELTLTVDTCVAEFNRFKVFDEASLKFIGQRIESDEQQTIVTLGLSFRNRDKALSFIDGLPQTLSENGNGVELVRSEILTVLKPSGLLGLPALFP